MAFTRSFASIPESTLSHTPDTMAKVPDPVWDHVTVIVKKKNNTQVECSFCFLKFWVTGFSRMYEHLAGGDVDVKTCPKCPKDVKEELRSVQLGRAMAVKRKAEDSQLDADTRAGPSSSKSASNAVKFGDVKQLFQQSTGGAEAADMAVAQWTYENGVPFKAVGNSSFSRMCKAVKEAGANYKPPSRKKLAGSLLVKASFLNTLALRPI
jgi:hypothetical protein